MQARPTAQSLLKQAEGDPLFATIPIKPAQLTEAVRQERLMTMKSATSMLDAYNQFYKAEEARGRQVEWKIDPSNEVSPP